MIDQNHELPVKRQAEVLGISRSSVYYVPRPVSEADLALMRRIDESHLEHPFAGSRMLRDLLKQEGFEVGRKHVATLMRRMGIEALYRKPHLSKPHPEHRVFPYRLRGLAIERPNRCGPWTVATNRPGLCVPGCGHGLVQPQNPRLAAL